MKRYKIYSYRTGELLTAILAISGTMQLIETLSDGSSEGVFMASDIPGLESFGEMPVYALAA